MRAVIARTITATGGDQARSAIGAAVRRIPVPRAAGDIPSVPAATAIPPDGGMEFPTLFALKLGLFQHPRLIRHTFRMPEESRAARVWHRLRGAHPAAHQVEVELRPESTVWVQVKGRLAPAGAEKLVAGLREALRRTEDRMILDLGRLLHAEPHAAESIAAALQGYRDRIRVVMPLTGEIAALAALFALYR